MPGSTSWKWVTAGGLCQAKKMETVVVTNIVPGSVQISTSPKWKSDALCGAGGNYRYITGTITSSGNSATIAPIVSDSGGFSDSNEMGCCNNDLRNGSISYSYYYDNGVGGGGGGGNAGVNGSCGTTSNSCTSGTMSASNLPDGIYHYWDCLGSGGGANAYSCSFLIPPAASNGVCGTTQQYTCIPQGTLNINQMTETATAYNWICRGFNGGTSANCTFAKTPPPPDTSCGTANGKKYPATATSYGSDTFCGPGNYSAPASVAFPDPGGYHLWTCANNPAQTNNIICRADRAAATAVVNGVCSAVGLVNICDAGTSVVLPETSTNYLWNCTGSGGGTTANCFHEKTVVPPPVVITASQCGTAQKAYLSTDTAYSGTLCSIGNSYPPNKSYWPTPGTYIPAFPTTGGSSAWWCVGSSGADAQCTATRAAAPATPLCGTTLNTCSPGTFVDSPDTATDYIWNCTNPGATSKVCTLPIPTSSATLTTNSCEPNIPGRIRITWSPIAGASTYQILNNGVDFASVPNTRLYYDFNNGAGVSNVFTVRGLINGTTWSAPTNGVSLPTPAAPTIPVVTTNPINNGDALAPSQKFYLTGRATVSYPTSYYLKMDFYYKLNPTDAWTLSTSTTINQSQLSRVGQFSLGQFTADSTPGDHIVYYKVVAYPSCIADFTNQSSTYIGQATYKVQVAAKNGSCSTTINLCSSGTFADVDDTAAKYLWNCVGETALGGTTDNCSQDIVLTQATCGTATGNYGILQNFPAGPYCSLGNPIPNPPGNPVANSPSIWTCSGPGLIISGTCQATRSAADLAMCNPDVAKNFGYSEPFPASGYCSLGGSTPVSPANPTASHSANWDCGGPGFTTVSCSATREPQPTCSLISPGTKINIGRNSVWESATLLPCPNCTKTWSFTDSNNINPRTISVTNPTNYTLNTIFSTTGLKNVKVVINGTASDALATTINCTATAASTVVLEGGNGREI